MMLADTFISQSPWGPLCLQGNAVLGLKAISFAPQHQALQSFESNRFLQHVADRLQHYWHGKPDTFADIPLAPEGTPFQQSVWQALRTIPFGETRSYKWLAEAVGKPSGFRAVGQANGKNPIPIIIPCHRVVNHNGNLGGYSGGLPIKRHLLDLETGCKPETLQREFALV